MRTTRHIWGVTAVLFAATCLGFVAVYQRFPGGLHTAFLQWTLLGAWLPMPVVAVWQQLRESDRGPATLNAAMRIAVVGYVGVMVVLWLMHRMLTT